MPSKLRSLVALCVLVWASWAAAEEQPEYFAVFMDNVKVGHCVETRRVEGDKVLSSYLMALTIERMGVPLTMSVTQECVETAGGKPVSFKMVMDMSLLSQVVQGSIGPDGKLTVTSGGVPQTMDWPAGALLTEGVRLLQKRHGLKEGVTYSYVEFDPTSLRGVETKIRVRGRKSVDVLGKPETLWEVAGQAQGIESLAYYDDQLNLRKNITAEGGMNLQIVACPKEFALGETTSLDVLAKMLVPSPRPLDDLPGAASASYRLVPTGDAKLTVPSYDNQKVLADAGGLTIVITAQKAPTGAMPYAGTDPSIREALKPSAYLTSDRPEVIALAQQAIGNAPTAAEAIKRIEAFVRQYIQSKGYDVGYANAAEVVASKTGDCTEHAVLAAAMCRAVGIPAKMVAGMVYTREFDDQTNVFCPHAWVMAYLGDRWVQFDPTLPQGYDLGHIALAAGDGSPMDYLTLGKVMGAFRIEMVSIRRQPAPAPAATDRRSSPD